jgi:hypothetical protein
MQFANFAGGSKSEHLVGAKQIAPPRLLSAVVAFKSYAGGVV